MVTPASSSNRIQPRGVHGTSARPPDHSAPTLIGVKSVHVLGRIYGREDRRRVDVRRKRQLNEDPVDVFARVELEHEQENGLARDGLREPMYFAGEAGFLCRFLFVAHVHHRRLAFAREDDVEPRWSAVLRGEPRRAGLSLCSNLFGDRFPTQYGCCHGA